MSDYFYYYLIIFILMIFFIGMADTSSNQTTKPVEKKEEYTANKENAKIMAKIFIKDKLKVPSSAKFESFLDMDATYIGDDTYEVIVECEAENSFGTLTANIFKVELQFFDPKKGGWRLLDIKEIQ